MKKIFFLAMIAMFVLSKTYAQMEKIVTKDTTRISKQAGFKTIQTKSSPPASTPPPPPPPVSQAPAPVYTLTSARIIIKTGTDNKEFPSQVGIKLWLKGQGWDYDINCLSNTEGLKNEMAINSTTNLGLAKRSGNADKFLLSKIQEYGLELRVSYFANFLQMHGKLKT